ncbi:crosslink repair DNA glycosylase YcaQ family protein [Cellulomonas sp. 73-92]|uniref:winged helix-turn-helix domain-containing protein n=1 Tax=Cellulomonas sp. 73-92 TaxID=1895740 RepID=UPI000A68A4AB|nr:crosslink repair DNA glycosylase YcaQ family protein [Cellulomonas sp. 73-92]
MPVTDAPARAVAHLTMAQARRIALRAAGLDRARPDGPVTARDVGTVVDRLGVVQIDSVNVFARAHLMPLYARLGAFDAGLVDRAANRAPRRLVESWAHMASFVTPETYRLLGWRRQSYLRDAWGMVRDVPLQHAPVVDDIRALLADAGPLTAEQVHARLGHERPQRPDDQWGWNWTVSKRVLEYLFFTGQAASAGRNGAFERRYDLVERVLPRAVLGLPEPDERDAVRELVATSIRALGVGTLRCVADYFRLRQAPTALALAELAEEGVVEPVVVDGWGTGWRHVGATAPRTTSARTLLSPFDPLVWERTRVEALFGLRYRIEIYTPAAKRTWGYYVLPFLLGDRVVALVDLKADRQDGVLRVLAAHPVGGAVAGVPAELAAELRVAAGWLGLSDVVVADRDGNARGELAGPLATALGA